MRFKSFKKGFGRRRLALFLAAFLFWGGWFPPAFLSARAKEVNKDIDFLALSVGFQHDYKLPEDYKGQKLRFEGTYKKLAGISYRKKENDIRFVPKRKGTAVLIIKNAKNEILKKLNIDVKKTNLHQVAKEVSDLLIAVDGISVKILNGKVVIDGEIFLPRDMDRIASVVAEYTKNRVVSLVTFSPEAQVKIARLIEEKIEIPEVSVNVVYNKFILRGTVDSDDDRKRAEIIANLYTRVDLEGSGAGPSAGGVRKKGAQGVINLIQIRPPKKDPPPEKKLIQIVVHYVELHKSFNKGFAFQWSPTINDGTTVNVSGGGIGSLPFALTATINNLFPKLNWAKSFNFARVLHNASLMLEDGSQGNIDVNTSIPITAQTSTGMVSTNQAQEALVTNLKPEIVGPMKDMVKIEVTFSATNVTGRSNQGPLITTRKLTTKLRVRAGLSAVLGGLISSNMRKNFNRLPPGQGESPPLFTLQSSKNYDVSKSQFVVFITPTITALASTGTSRIKKKFKLDES